MTTTIDTSSWKRCIRCHGWLMGFEQRGEICNGCLENGYGYGYEDIKQEPSTMNDYATVKATADAVIAEQVVGTTSVLLFRTRQCYHVILSTGMRERCGRKLKGGERSFDFWVARLSAA